MRQSHSPKAQGHHLGELRVCGEEVVTCGGCGGRYKVESFNLPSCLESARKADGEEEMTLIEKDSGRVGRLL